MSQVLADSPASPRGAGSRWCFQSAMTTRGGSDAVLHLRCSSRSTSWCSCSCRGWAEERFTYAFATVPQEIRTGKDWRGRSRCRSATSATIPLQPTPVSVYLTLLTSMFMHGGLMHLFGNMLFLWIFGDNIEDDSGTAVIWRFYLVTGVIASLAHVYRRSPRRQPVSSPVSAHRARSPVSWAATSCCIRIAASASSCCGC